MATTCLKKVINSGRPGACQEVIVAARRYGLETGGWSRPFFWNGHWGAVWLRAYGLKELQRGPGKMFFRVPFANVRDSDGTAWFGSVKNDGCVRVREAIHRFRRPIMFVTQSKKIGDDPKRMADWIEKNAIEVLNVESYAGTDMGLGMPYFAKRFMVKVFLELGLKALQVEHDFWTPTHFLHSECWCNYGPQRNLNNNVHHKIEFLTLDVSSYEKLKSLNHFQRSHSCHSSDEIVDFKEVPEYPSMPFVRHWGVYKEGRMGIQAIEWIK